MFGRNRVAAVCLPCCYYAPPNEAFAAPSFSSLPIDTLEVIVEDKNDNDNENEIIVDDNDNYDNENNFLSVGNAETLTNSVDIEIKEG